MRSPVHQSSVHELEQGDQAGSEPSRLDRAGAVLDLVDEDPGAALEAADRILAETTEHDDAAATSIVQRARGRALLYLGDVDAALGAFKRAVAVAQGADEDRLAALARMSMAGPLTHAGRPGEALHELDLATTVLTGTEAGVVELQRAQVLQRQAPSGEMLRRTETSFAKAELLFRERGDTRMQAQALNSWGLHYAFQGRTEEARLKLETARRLYVKVGLEASVADMDNNLGWVAALAGDFPTAQERFAKADVEFTRLEMPLGELRNDRCQMLLAAGLASEARSLAAKTAAELAAAGAAGDAAEATLLHAHAALLDQDPSAAEASAKGARRALAGQGRIGWTWQARILELRAAVAGGRTRKTDLTAAQTIAQRAEVAGMAWAALQARLTAGRIAAFRGERTAAESHLRHVQPLIRHAPVEYRVEYAAVKARNHLASGDREAAARVARLGLNTLDRYRSMAGATDVRAHLGLFGAELGEIGLRLAIQSGKPARSLSWMERTRAGAMRFTPARPPADAGLAADLTELRGVIADIRAAEVDGESPDEMLRHQARIQDRIRRRTRLRPAESADARKPNDWTQQDLKNRLEDRVLVSIAESGGEVFAVVVRRRSRLIRLGPVGSIRNETTALRSALSRLARPRRSIRTRDADRDAAVHSASLIDEQLLQPLRIADEPLVIIPPPSLAALPWALIPSLRDRPFAVAPSADLWFRRAGQPRSSFDRVVLAAGPGLEQANTELRSVGRLYPDAIRFTAHRSRVSEITEALNGATLAHFACHGSFRPDNPMFSSLEFGDGALFVHDLEQIERSPETIVLSACESGLSSARPGNEMLGLAASLLMQGTRTLIGSVVPVPDTRATRRFVTTFHRELQMTEDASYALLAARRAVTDDPVVAGAFVCFGAG